MGGYWDLLVSQPPMKSPICETISNNLMLILEHEFNFNSIVFYWPAVKLIQLIGISGIPQWFSDKESTYSAGDPGLITQSARSPGGGNGNPLWYSSLENPMDREASWATVSEVTKSQTLLRTEHTHTYVLYITQIRLTVLLTYILCGFTLICREHGFLIST